MQDTPQFENIKQQFLAQTEQKVIGDDGRQKITDSQVITLLKRIFETVPLYLNDQPFRDTLTLQAKQNIESQIQAIINQFQEVDNWKNQNQLPQNMQNLLNNLGSYYEELRLRFITPYKLHVAEGNADVAKSLAEIEKIKDDSEKDKKEIEKILESSKDLASHKGATLLANYFYKIYSGRIIEDEENKKSNKKLKPKYIPKWWHNGLAIVTAGLLAIAAAPTYSYIEGLSLKSKVTWLIFLMLMLLLALAYFSYLGIKKFNELYVGGYERASKIWALIVVLSLLIIAIYTLIVVKQLHIENGIKIEEAIIKIVVLLAPVYFIRFAVRNYSANKHLAAVNQQRATSIRVSELFLNSMNDKNSAAYVQMVKLLFSQDETGFITRKEGAGSSDTNFELPGTK